AADQCHADDAAGAGNRGRDLLFGDLSRPDAGGRSGRARVRSLHRGTAVHGDRRRAAGLGLVVRGETPAPDDGGRMTEGENERPQDAALITRAARVQFAQKSNRIADIRAVRVGPGADARRILPSINPLGRLVNLTRTLAPLLGPARVSDLTQQSGRRAM